MCRRAGPGEEDGPEPGLQVFHRVPHARQDRGHGRHQSALRQTGRDVVGGLRAFFRSVVGRQAHRASRRDFFFFVAVVQDAQFGRRRLPRHGRRLRLRQGHGLRGRLRDARAETFRRALARGTRGGHGRHGPQLLAANARGHRSHAQTSNHHGRLAPRGLQRALLRRRRAPRRTGRAPHRAGAATTSDHRRGLDPVLPRLRWRRRRPGQRLPRPLRAPRPAGGALRRQEQRPQLPELEVRATTPLRPPRHARHHRQRLRRPPPPHVRRPRHRHHRHNHRRSHRRHLQRRSQRLDEYIPGVDSSDPS
mmetsp:Transcript_18909/g.58248  ORF Transcript_18909/g.58248 Transcript_18909/m.58248 type:complete len:306 (+) Transcript_18909:466-1383(+)